MVQDVTVWHYLAGFGVFCWLGVVAHVCRAVFNPLTDKLSGRPVMEMARSDGFNSDWLLGTDYDAGGYYRLGSLRNLRNAIAPAAFSGLCVMTISPDVAALMARVIDTGVDGLGYLVAFRLENASWS